LATRNPLRLPLHTTEVDSSHAAVISHPKETTDLIFATATTR
jgi:hypothetical protein